MLIDRIIKILKLHIAEITRERINDDLIQMGMNSIVFIRIVTGLEREFDIEIPDEHLLMTAMNTMNKMAVIIGRELEGRRN